MFGASSRGVAHLAFINGACRKLHAGGNDSLSESQKGETIGASEKNKKSPVKPPEKKPGRQRASDVGRALRSVYDETLREQVPDDFSDLLGKLS